MTTSLKFRNIEASPEDPVQTWPFEGILAAVERGTLPDWRRLAEAIDADPWGPVAQQVIEALSLSRPMALPNCWGRDRPRQGRGRGC